MLFNIRSASSLDLDKVRKLISNLFPSAFINLSEFDLIFLAEFEGRFVGFLHLIETEDAFLLQGLGVKPEFRSRGVGSLLLSKLSEVTFELPKPIYLKVKPLSPAIDLYLRRGFFIKKFNELDAHVLILKPNS